MSANLENLGLEKVTFHSNPKEGQYQRMYKLLYNCTYFTFWLCPKSFKLGFSSTRTKNFQMYKLGLEKVEEQSNFQHSLDHEESKGVPEKHLLLLH